MKIGSKTLGCKVNIYEMEYLLNCFKEKGYEITENVKEADFYLINTCTVTNQSDAKSRQIINHLIKENPNIKLIVMGCYSQNNAELLQQNDNIVIILGSKNKAKLMNYFDEYLHNNNKIIDISNNETELNQMHIASLENHLRAFVKIQDGCDSFCSYCIIPYVRGKIRSKGFAETIKEIKTLVKNNYQEIVLAGIHTGKYGKDINSSLKELLTELVKIPDLKRIRISSIEINEIVDILPLLSNPKIVNHFHIPLQSGSAKILKLMARRYTKEEYLDIISKIRNILPNCAITTDLIVGFPGEDEDDFKETYAFLKAVGFSKIHVFPYSKRNNTKAALMNNQVDGVVKKRRVKEIIQLSKELEEEYILKSLRTYVDVLIEQVNKDYVCGYTTSYLKVYLPYQENLLNKIVRVELISYIDNRIIGKVIES